VHSVDLDDPQLTYNPRNSSELAKLFPSIHWRDYFSGFSPRPTFPDPVIVSTVRYFRKLAGIVDMERDDVLEAYFVWRTAQEVRAELAVLPAKKSASSRSHSMVAHSVLAKQSARRSPGCVRRPLWLTTMSMVLRAQLDAYLRGVEEGVRETRADVCLRSLIDHAGFLVGRCAVPTESSAEGSGMTAA
jgi:endothelin-converting enzyme